MYLDGGSVKKMMMKCSSCNFESTKVVDSRVTENLNSIRRRRECERCGFRYTTFEKAQTASLMIHKKDGSTEPYDREKLEKAIEAMMED